MYKTLLKHRDVLPLLIAAMTTAFAITNWTTSMPFIVKYRLVGRTDFVGYAAAGHSVVYFLLCMTNSFRFAHLPVKLTSLIGQILMLGNTIAMGVIVRMAPTDIDNISNVWMVAIFCAFISTAVGMSLFWPYLMGWMSSNYEGKDLSRRLGLYNIAWSGGAILGPVTAGFLLEINYMYPFIAAAVAQVIGFTALVIMPKSVKPAAAESEPVSEEPSSPSSNPATRHIEIPSEINAFRLASAVSLMCCWGTVYLMNTQLGLLLKSGLGMSESHFGSFLMVLALTRSIALAVMGNTHFWHFRKDILFLTLALPIIALTLVFFCRQLWQFWLIGILLGIAVGLNYTFHMFYRLTGSLKRSRSMAIHEAVLALGCILFALGGGIAGEYFSIYAPYIFGIGLVVICWIAQGASWKKACKATT